MKNHSFFSGLMLALCFVFLATTAQAQNMQTLYKVTKGLFIEDGRSIESNEATGIYISIYETAQAKINIALISKLGNVGYNYTTWYKHGEYIAGPLQSLTLSTQELRATEFEATWKGHADDTPYDDMFFKVYIGQAKPATEILFIIYNNDGTVMALYSAKMAFYGIIE